MKRLLSGLLTLAMVCSLVPTPALAEAVDEVGSSSQVDVAPVEEAGEGEAAPDEQATEEVAVEPDLAVQDATEDPFWLVDAQTGERVTTLHTSRQYLLKDAAGLHHLMTDSLYFTCKGSDGRGNTDPTYCVHVDDADPSPASYECARIARLEAEEGLLDSADRWALPTGTYTVAFAPAYGSDQRTVLSQEYDVVCDGPFYSFFSNDVDFAARDHMGIYAYSEEGGEDDQYYDGFVTDDQGQGQYDEHGQLIPLHPEVRRTTLALADDLRLRFEVRTAQDMGATGEPTLQGIALWRAPADTVEALGEAYGNGAVYRAEGIDGWPNVWNMDDESEVVHLWDRGDADLREHFSRNTTGHSDDQGEFVEDYCAGGEIVIPRVSFSEVAGVSDGVYFPVVRASYGDETYIYVYYPVEVSTEGVTVERRDPRITTAAALPHATKGEPYAVTLAGRTGAAHQGTFAWSVDGSLPAGLALDGATGAIEGTPTELGAFSFAITLTETIDGEACTATKQLSLDVRNDVSLRLGEIAYDPGVVRLPQSFQSSATIDLRVPISRDVRDAELDLSKTEVWYALMLEDDGGDPVWHIDRRLATDMISADGSTLTLKPLVQSYGDGAYIAHATGIARAAVMLVPRHNDGTYAFDTSNAPAEALASLESIGFELFANQVVQQGETYTAVGDAEMTADGAWDDMPQMPTATLDDVDVQFGSYLRFGAIDDDVVSKFDGQARVRLWRAGVVPTEATTLEASLEGGAEFEVDPGTYLFVVEAPVRTYDEVGNEVPGVFDWVDVSAGPSEVQEAKGWLPLYYSEEGIDALTVRRGSTPAISGTSPRQHLVTVGSNHTCRVTPNVSAARFSGLAQTSLHTLRTRLAQEPDGAGTVTYVEDVNASWEARWYRRKVNGDSTTTDVLVATGDSVVLGPSEFDLYVEVVPQGSTASFWEASGKVRVSDKNKIVTVNLERKQLFSGTFALSCASGRTPAAGERWGMIEVRTPLVTGGVSTTNQWVSGASSTVEVPGLVTGSVVTFTPEATLKAGAVSYEVTQTEGFADPVALVAPLPDGMVTFEGLSYVDAHGSTQPILLNDGQTDVTIEFRHPRGWTESAPFHVVDGTSLVIEPNGSSNPTMRGFVGSLTGGAANYSVTITHRDGSASERLGMDAPDYAVRQTFSGVQLAVPDQEGEAMETTVCQESTPVSRGYAGVELSNPQNMACELLLYHTGGALVDHGPAGGATQVRTPYLEAGPYTLYAVDSSLVPLARANEYGSQATLDRLLQRSENRSRGTSVAFDVEDGKVTTSPVLAFPTWSGTELVGRAQSAVFVDAAYSSQLSIRMHAELAAGVRLGDGAYLEVATNQPSGESGAGWTNPKALNINGKAVAINRWTNLFGGYQNMEDGTLRVMLGETKKFDPACARFPMDMTLVIPRRNMAATEVQVWLVSGTGDDAVRSLVGTYRQQVREASVTVPPVAAWKSFGAYGQTAPYAQVALYVDGMRSATTQADNFGFYQATITLPDDVRDFDEFAISAMATWTHGEQSYSAATSVERVLYSTTVPAVERVVMCYQPNVGTDYEAVTTYERGYLRNRYRSLYRSEHDDQKEEGADHAKFFWLTEFANDQNRRVAEVTMRVPRSDGAVTMKTTDALQTAQSWIPDVRKAAAAFGSDEDWWNVGTAGRDAYRALTDQDLHAFVSHPTYFVASPHDLELSLKMKQPGRVIEPMEPALNLGTYTGWQGVKVGESPITQDQLAACISAMDQDGFARLCGKDDSLTSYASPDAHAAFLHGTAGSVDEQLFVANEVGGFVQLRHKVTTTTTDVGTEVRVRLAAAKKVTDAYERWLADGTIPADRSVAFYDGACVADAGGTQSTGSESIPYMIETFDEEGNLQLEAFYAYWIADDEGNDQGTHVYYRDRMTKDAWIMTQWNESTGQRIDMTYELADACKSARTPSGQAYRFADVVNQWYWVQRYLLSSVVAADGQLTTDAGGSMGGQSLSTQDVMLEVQGFPWDQLETLGTWATKCTATSAKVLPDETKYPQRLDDIRNNPNKDVQYAADPASGWWSSPQAQAGTLGGLNNFGEKGPLMADMTTTVAYNSGEAMVGARGGPSTWLAVNTVALPPARSAFEEKWREKVDGQTPGGGQQQEQKSEAEREREDYEKNRNDRYAIRNGLQPSKDYWRIRAQYPADKLDEWDKKGDKETESWTWLSKPNPDVVEDPSGIVYEAVLSNPVQGATVTLYTFNGAAAMAGMDDPAQFLDSKQFGIEENPQVTGADGRYQWFVPEGYWQVRVSKEGYEDFNSGDPKWAREEDRPVYGTDGSVSTQRVTVGGFGIDATKTLTISGADGTPQTVEAAQYWMPVLPVQLDVNLPLVSLEPPVIDATEADETGVTVTFSKYVKVESVTADLFALDGKTPAGVEPVDAEEAGDGSGVMLARTFRLSYADGTVDPGAAVQLTFNDPEGKVASYAGVAMDESKRTLERSLEAEASRTDISGARVTCAQAQLAWTGQALTPAVVVTLGDATLAAGTDYDVAYANNVAPGTATVTVTGKGAYKGTARASFKIVARAFDGLSVSAIPAQTYTGAPLTPKPTVALGGKTLREGADYTLSFANNVNAGTATVTVTGRGSYAGTRTATFAINRAPGALDVEAQACEVLLKKAKKKAQKVRPAAATRAVGGVTFSKVSGAKELAVAADGTVTLRKGVKKVKTFRAVVRVAAAGDANHEAASREVTVVVKVVKKLTNPLSVEGRTATVKAGRSAAAKKLVSVRRAKGKVTYKKASGNKGITVAANGKVSVRKGTRPGTYKLKLKVTAAGNGTYKKAAKSAACYVVVP